MEKCPCGQDKEIHQQWSLARREMVEVLCCLCGREREVIEKGDFRFVHSCHDKYKILADKL